MTRKEAIKELQESHDMMRSYNIDENESRLMTALNMAIKALSQEPTIGQLFSCEEVEELRSKIWKQVEQEPCEDAVSREDAFEIIASNDTTDGTEPIFTGRQVVALLSTLPPVTQKSGKWIKKEDDTCWWYVCSECEQEPLKNRWNDEDVLSTFCPNCGARMESEVNE